MASETICHRMDWLIALDLGQTAKIATESFLELNNPNVFKNRLLQKDHQKNH